MNEQDLNYYKDGDDYLYSSYPGDAYDRPDVDDEQQTDEPPVVVTMPGLYRSEVELLPGAIAQYVEGKYEHRIAAIKALRRDYSTGLAYAKYSVDVVYPMNSAQSIITKYAARQDIDEPKYVEQDNPQVEMIDTMRDIQRQMLDLLDELKECSREIYRNGNLQPHYALDNYVIANIECAVTSDHQWVGRSTSIDSIIEELEEENDNS